MRVANPSTGRTSDARMITESLHLLALVDSSADFWFGHGVVGVLMVVGGGLALRHAARLNSLARAIEKTKTVTTAAAQSGLVRVRGRIESAPRVMSPFTQTACCCYQAEIEEPSDDGSSTGMGWRPLHTAISRERFALRDQAGTIEIDPQGMQLDVAPTLTREVISRAGDAREEAMLEYVRQNCPNPGNRMVLEAGKRAFLSPEQQADPRVREGLRQLEQRSHQQLHKKTEGQSFLFRETCLLPGQEFEVAGTVRREGTDRVIGEGPPGSPFLLSARIGAALSREQHRKTRNFALISCAVFIGGMLVLIFRW
jgi:hypothetical protein